MPDRGVLVRFLVREAPWEAWEVVELSGGEAEKFIRRGVAEAAPRADSKANDEDAPRAVKRGRRS